MSSYDSVILADGPAGYWKLDEAAGATQFIDSSGNGLHLAITDGSSRFSYQQTALTVFNSSLKDILTGSTPSYGDVASWPGTTNATLEAWINIPATTGNSFTPIYIGDSSADGFGIYLGQSGGGSGSPTLIQILFGGVRFCTPTFAPVAGKSYHVVATISASFALYINGVRQGSVDVGTGPISPSAITSVFAEAANPSGTGTVFLEKVAAYTFAISSGRALAHYRAGIDAGIRAKNIRQIGFATSTRSAI